MRFIPTIMAAAAVFTMTNAMAADKPTIALIHGAFENGQIWQGVEAKLKEDGYRVLAPTLPGRAGNPLSADKVTLQLYRDEVVKLVKKEKKPVVLVGHSFGGITISEVAEAIPKKVRTLVFVAAYLPKDGDSLLTLANQDKDAEVGPHLQIDKEHGIAVVERSARADLFANGAPEQLRAAIPDFILDEPLAPLATPVKLTAANFGKVDKVYVHTAYDKVVSPSLQKAMVATSNVRLETAIDSGHTPFLTQPGVLVEAIEKAATTQ